MKTSLSVLILSLCLMGTAHASFSIGPYNTRYTFQAYLWDSAGSGLDLNSSYAVGRTASGSGTELRNRFSFKLHGNLNPHHSPYIDNLNLPPNEKVVSASITFNTRGSNFNSYLHNETMVLRGISDNDVYTQRRFTPNGFEDGNVTQQNLHDIDFLERHNIYAVRDFISATDFSNPDPFLNETSSFTVPLNSIAISALQGGGPYRFAVEGFLPHIYHPPHSYSYCCTGLDEVLFDGSGTHPPLSAAELRVDTTLIGPPPGPATVPVPAAAWLFGSGLLGLIGLSKRKSY